MDMATKKDEKDERLIAIGQKLKRMRKEAGYTNYEYLAWELEMGRAQYSRLETGNNFNMTTLFRLLDAYGMSLSEFFAEFEEKKEAGLERMKGKAK